MFDPKGIGLLGDVISVLKFETSPLLLNCSQHYVPDNQEVKKSELVKAFERDQISDFSVIPSRHTLLQMTAASKEEARRFAQKRKALK